MGTEILKSFGTLQSELEQAKTSLKGVDENIKRLIGRDPSDLPPRAVIKRTPIVGERRVRLSRNRSFNHENDEPVNKRRAGVSVFKRLSERVNYDEDVQQQQPQKQMISKVIVTPKELPSRQEALAAQSKDEKSKARNRRMFGALLGTLQKFQQEETKLKQKEEKRAQVERKIEEHETKEKEEIKKERQELFFNRKKKQAEIKMIELKMMRMKEYATWEERQKPRMNFIVTKSKPHIQYLPRRLTEQSKTLLEECKGNVEKMIDKKRQEVFDELQHIEERMKKNFEMRKQKDGKEDGDGIDLLSKLEEGEIDHPIEDKEKEEEEEEEKKKEDISEIIETLVTESADSLTNELQEEDNKNAAIENNKVEEESTSRETEQTVETEKVVENCDVKDYALMEVDTSECL